ncbi:carboxypeptidase-like regulatory domain-containing protein [Taibaiella helva]|uniref:carboxypeptidase-like regulatory domain-containing protein n=1 Tax=Taibaiella helva TaxID=2301235 RepID=UPI000E592EFC|nr:carboxypeptidase-like regulatory domain-containing protein [Taibaiella helva]
MKLLLLLLLFPAMIIKAQSIKVIVSNEKGGLPNTTIRLFQDSLLKRVGITDSTGTYTYSGLQKGDYLLEISSSGYERKTALFHFSGDTVIGIRLMETTKTLSEVTVSSKKPLLERKIDRLVFNVAGNINVVGSDLLDLLSKTPQVDVRGSSISIIGRGGVTIMINEKVIQVPPGAPLVAYLKAIPAETVERIEVMPNPPASYSAAGEGGIINIILKKNRTLGYSGTVGLNLSKGGAYATYPSILEFYFSHSSLNCCRSLLSLRAIIFA